MINGRVVLLDVSFWQDDDHTPYKIDFNKSWAAGADGVIIRAGQNVWLDEDFLDYVRNANEARFPKGAYWFYDSRVSPIPQADIFSDVIDDIGFPQLGIWGDFEERYGGSWGGEVNFLIFMNRLRERFPGRLIGVYTAPSYWNEKVTSLTRNAFKDFPLWIAHYRVDEPNVPDPWDDYLIWQITDQANGLKFGAESKEIDMDLFAGSLEEYKTYFNLPNYEPAPEQPPTGEQGMFEVTTIINNLTLRTDRYSTASKIILLPLGTIMNATEILPPSQGGIEGDKWAHGDVIVGGVRYNGWIAVIHNGVTYSTYKELPQGGEGLPTLTVTLEGQGYPTLTVEWKPNEQS